MSEFKGTKGEWYVERTSSEDGDFQGRILCKSSEKKSPHKDEPQIYIIAGEPSKRNGVANILYEANAKLIASAPDLLEACQEMLEWFGKRGGVTDDLLPMQEQDPEIQNAIKAIKKALK